LAPKPENNPQVYVFTSLQYPRVFGQPHPRPLIGRPAAPDVTAVPWSSAAGTDSGFALWPKPRRIARAPTTKKSPSVVTDAIARLQGNGGDSPSKPPSKSPNHLPGPPLNPALRDFDRDPPPKAQLFFLRLNQPEGAGPLFTCRTTRARANLERDETGAVIRLPRSPAVRACVAPIDEAGNVIIMFTIATDL